MKIRKQVYELTPDDLKDKPVWEFCLDEEGDEDQDEATVRPYDGPSPVDPDEGMFVLACKFILSDGTCMNGYVSPPFENDDSISTLQPILVTNEGQVGFWCGIVSPESENLTEYYSILEKDADSIFPVRFDSEAEFIGGPISGEIPAFLGFKSFDDQSIVEIT